MRRSVRPRWPRSRSSRSARGRIVTRDEPACRASASTSDGIAASASPPGADAPVELVTDSFGFTWLVNTTANWLAPLFFVAAPPSEGLARLSFTIFWENLAIGIAGWAASVCGLAAVVLFAGRDLPRENAYPLLIREYLPAGARGLLFAGLYRASGRGCTLREGNTCEEKT